MKPPERNRLSVAPYGSWASPLTAARVTAGALRLGDIVLDGDDVYWVEGRAAEGGRQVVVRWTAAGGPVDVTPPEFSVRSRVHEYGGAAFTVDRGTVYFSNFADQRLYMQRPDEEPRPITPAGYFYADARMDRRRGRLLAVREDHTRGDAEPVNTIVAIETPESPGWTDANGNDPGIVLVEGFAFVSDPILSPDGGLMAWIGWRHPGMPWDGTELWVADVAPDGSLGARAQVAGGAEESIFQPEWSPDGVLYFVSDRTGWWNLYRVGDAGAEAPTLHQAPALRHATALGVVEAVHPMAAEFGKPQWSFTMVTYAFVDESRMAVTYVQDGRWRLAFIETRTNSFEPVALPTDPLESIRSDSEAAYFVGGSPTQAPAIVRLPLATLIPEILRSSTAEAIDPEWISVPEPVTFTAGTPGTSGTSGDRNVHAFYYPPRNPDFRAPDGMRPPLIVLTHGGPTGATEAVLDPEIQFWTSRGFGVLDVNYSGSTGYGRAYRDRLKGQWGVVDVEDAVAGAVAMVDLGRADRNRLAIHGGSAGGYTTLAALVFHDVFKAGASYYGISDIEVLARQTHKFESRYLDSLIGPYPAARDLYVARSPIHATDRLSSALILFQGLEDEVVPPNQSEMMADAARRNGLPVAYLAYPGEQHGFRRRENIIRSLEAELYFYGKVFGFEPADPIESVPIDNL
jgi:dipeptidyl aminopeptidase/acylaminoacyl peptidase